MGRVCAPSTIYRRSSIPYSSSRPERVAHHCPPLYANMEKRWAEVAYVPMQLDRAAAENQSLGVLHLTP